MRTKEYAVLEQAVEDGVARGWNRAHKHNPTPSEMDIKGAMVDAIMLSIAEWFDFYDPGRTYPDEKEKET